MSNHIYSFKSTNSRRLFKNSFFFSNSFCLKGLQLSNCYEHATIALWWYINLRFEALMVIVFILFHRLRVKPKLDKVENAFATSKITIQVKPGAPMEVKLSAFLGNYDRQTNKPSNRLTNWPKTNDRHKDSYGSKNSNIIDLVISIRFFLKIYSIHGAIYFWNFCHRLHVYSRLRLPQWTTITFHNSLRSMRQNMSVTQIRIACIIRI